MNRFKWSTVIISSGLICGIFAPFPLILVPVLLGGFVTYAIATNQMTNRSGFLWGLVSVYLSFFPGF